MRESDNSDKKMFDDKIIAHQKYRHFPVNRGYTFFGLGGVSIVD